MSDEVIFPAEGACPVCDAAFELTQAALVCAKCGCDLTALAAVIGLPALAYNQALRVAERDPGQAAMLLVGVMRALGDDEPCRTLLCHLHVLAESAEAEPLLRRLSLSSPYRRRAAERAVERRQAAAAPAAAGSPGPAAAAPAAGAPTATTEPGSAVSATEGTVRTAASAEPSPDLRNRGRA